VWYQPTNSNGSACVFYYLFLFGSRESGNPSGEFISSGKGNHTGVVFYSCMGCASVLNADFLSILSTSSTASLVSMKLIELKPASKLITLAVTAKKQFQPIAL